MHPISRKTPEDRMAYYFFHVVNDVRVFKDEAGQDFLSVDEARAHAVRIASELATEGEDYRLFVVCVVDDQGNEVARVPVSMDPQ
jgi:hypothetical protein